MIMRLHRQIRHDLPGKAKPPAWHARVPGEQAVVESAAPPQAQAGPGKSPSGHQNEISGGGFHSGSIQRRFPHSARTGPWQGRKDPKFDPAKNQSIFLDARQIKLLVCGQRRRVIRFGSQRRKSKNPPEAPPGRIRPQRHDQRRRRTLPLLRIMRPHLPPDLLAQLLLFFPHHAIISPFPPPVMSQVSPTVRPANFSRPPCR